MYGLPQAGILANKLLEKRLNAHGYFQHCHTPGLWAHRSRPIQFTLEKVEIIKHVMSSATEAETGALFINGKEAIPLRQTLIELNHPQPPTPIQTDNSTATGIVNKTVKLKRSKAMDMRFYWAQDRIDQ
jgi:hypothetical protein